MRLLPPLLFLILTLAMAGMSTFVSEPSLPFVVRGVGLGLLFAGLALTIGSNRQFIRVGTNINTFDDPDKLVLQGAFRYTRNPMYLGFLLALLGISLVMGRASTLFGPIVFFVASQLVYIPFEERRMLERFGADYDRYRSEVGRWIGRRASRGQ